MAASSAPAVSRLRRATFRQDDRDMKNPKGVIANGYKATQ
jgi:hypothetical protein